MVLRLRRLLTSTTALRWKLSAAIAAVSILVALGLSVVVHNAASRALTDNDRNVQDEQLAFAVKVYLTSGQASMQSRIDDPRLPQDLKRTVRDNGKRATGIDERSDPPVLWAAADVDGHTLSRRTTLGHTEDVLHDLDTWLFYGAGALVATGTGLGLLVGERLSRRLRFAADAARTVADGDYQVRVRDAVGGHLRDETTELASAVDAMSEALQERLVAERRVTADIAHELRTPVTGLVTAAELLPEGRPAEMVRDRAKVLRSLIEDVLEVSRLDGTTEQAVLSELSLRDFVEGRVSASHPDVTVLVNEDARVLTDARRLERILSNLLNNARKHGAPPVSVTVDGPVLRIRDHGPGYPEALVAEGPRRFRTGASERGTGHGLGLTIAAGQARVLQAVLTFRNHSEGGALTVLDLRNARVPAGSGDSHSDGGGDEGDEGDRSR